MRPGTLPLSLSPSLPPCLPAFIEPIIIVHSSNPNKTHVTQNLASFWQSYWNISNCFCHVFNRSWWTSTDIGNQVSRVIAINTQKRVTLSKWSPNTIAVVYNSLFSSSLAIAVLVLRRRRRHHQAPIVIVVHQSQRVKVEKERGGVELKINASSLL